MESPSANGDKAGKIEKQPNKRSIEDGERSDSWHFILRCAVKAEDHQGQSFPFIAETLNEMVFVIASCPIESGPSSVAHNSFESVEPVDLCFSPFQRNVNESRTDQAGCECFLHLCGGMGNEAHGGREVLHAAFAWADARSSGIYVDILRHTRPLLGSRLYNITVPSGRSLRYLAAQIAPQWPSKGN